jgi:PhzF family phenazine biosynthesis protein
MNIDVQLLKSFGVTNEGGNPAGAVLNAAGLTDEQKKAISKEVGYSETAFVEKSDKADFKVTFFTPTDEVDLCGHATIATYALLFQKGLVKSGRYTQELKAGVLGIEINNTGLVVMDQSLPIFSDVINDNDIRDIFKNYEGINNLDAEIVSTGLRDIMLPVKNRKELFALSPDFNSISALNRRTNSIGVHAFTLDTIDPDAIAHCRNFAPLYGIPEESATGSSNGALACYLFKHGKLEGKSLTNMKFEQGYSMNKPSEIFVTLQINNNQIRKVQVGGRAIQFGERKIEI